LPVIEPDVPPLPSCSVGIRRTGDIPVRVVWRIAAPEASYDRFSTKSAGTHFDSEFSENVAGYNRLAGGAELEPERRGKSDKIAPFAFELPGTMAPRVFALSSIEPDCS
jgi:hypothetical protein